MLSIISEQAINIPVLRGRRGLRVHLTSRAKSKQTNQQNKQKKKGRRSIILDLNASCLREISWYWPLFPTPSPTFLLLLLWQGCKKNAYSDFCFSSNLKFFRVNILHVATKSIKMAGSTTYPDFFFFLTDTQFSFSRFHNELWGGSVNLFPPKHLRTIFFFNLRMFMGNSNKETQNKSNTLEKGERKWKQHPFPPTSVLGVKGLRELLDYI